jgi:hypothetical protein
MKRWMFLMAGTALLAGCASLSSVVSDVSTFGDWPAGRQPGTYAFERLPSQEARASEVEPLEANARPALAKAGFKPVAAGQEPDVLVQVGARVARADRSPWDDPFWWRGSVGRWRHGPWYGPGWGLSYRYDTPRYDREVALLIRDRASGKPLFEARASSEGFSRADSTMLGAMFSAALSDFPKLGVNPRSVTIAISP